MAFRHVQKLPKVWTTLAVKVNNSKRSLRVRRERWKKKNQTIEFEQPRAAALHSIYNICKPIIHTYISWYRNIITYSRSINIKYFRCLLVFISVYGRLKSTNILYRCVVNNVLFVYRGGTLFVCVQRVLFFEYVTEQDNDPCKWLKLFASEFFRARVTHKPHVHALRRLYSCVLARC